MKPILLTKSIANPLRRAMYQRYLPNAFDTELTILEKVNKVIDNMNVLGILTGEMLDDWENFTQWLGEQGIEAEVDRMLEEWLEDGTLARKLEEQVLSSYATKEWVLNQLARKREITIHLARVYPDGKEIDENTYQFGSLKKAVEFLTDMAIPPSSAKIVSDEVGKYYWDEQIIIKNRDASFITIDGTFEIIVTNFEECFAIPSSPTNYEFVPALYGKSANLPTLRGIFTMAPVDSVNNVMDTCVLCQKEVDKDLFVFALLDGSSMVCTSGEVTVSKFPLAGIVVANGSHLTAHGIKVSDIGNHASLEVGSADKNGRGDGLLSINSTLSANKCEVYRCGGAGLNISQGSMADVDGSIISDNGHHGCLVTGASTASIKGSKISYTMDDDLVSYAGSSIDARDVEVTGNSRSRNYGVIATMESKIMFARGKLINTQYGVMANRGSSVDCTDATISTYPQTTVASDSARSAQGSVLILTNATVTNNTIGDVCTAEHGGRLVINNATLNGKANSKTVVMAYDGDVFGQEAKLTGGTDNCILATRGGHVTLYHSTIKGVDVADNECVHAYGGRIEVNACTITNAYRGLVATRGGSISASYAEIYASDLVCLAYGSEIDLTGGILHGKVQATRGGKLNMSGASITKVLECIMCYNGAIVNANEATSITGVELEDGNFTMDTNALKSTGIIFFDKTFTA